MIGATDGPPAAPPPRHRGLQISSILLIGFGLAVTLISVGLIQLEEVPVAGRRNVAFVLLGGALMLFVGVVMNAVRAILARRHLPPQRYRGPSIWLMLLAAVGLAGVATVPFGDDAQALLTGRGEISVAGALAILTSTQVALLVVTAVFVLAPGALVGARWLTSSNLRALLLGIGWGVPAWIGATILSVIVNVVLQALGIEPEPQVALQALELIDPVVALVAIVVVAPVAEEVFFRGVVYNAWLREYGFRAALVGSALLFGVIHLSLAAFVPIVALGVALVVVYRRYANLLAPIGMHAVFNGISVAFAYLVEVPAPAFG